MMHQMNDYEQKLKEDQTDQTKVVRKMQKLVSSRKVKPAIKANLEQLEETKRDKEKSYKNILKVKQVIIDFDSKLEKIKGLIDC